MAPENYRLVLARKYSQSFNNVEEGYQLWSSESRTSLTGTHQTLSSLVKEALDELPSLKPGDKLTTLSAPELYVGLSHHTLYSPVGYESIIQFMSGYISESTRKTENSKPQMPLTD